MDLINLSTKQPESAADISDATQKIISGTHGVYGDDIYPVIDPNGVPTKIKGDDLQKALSSGWRLRDIDQASTNLEEENKFKNSELQAMVTGALRGASGSASDWLLTKVFGVPPENLAKIRSYNPTISSASEIGGAIAPIMLSGGTGLIGKAAAKTLPAMLSDIGAVTAERIGEGIAGVAGIAPEATGLSSYLPKLAGKAIGSAIEGAAYGAMEYSTEQALKDPEFQGESLLAHMGESALMGGKLGIALPVGVDIFGTVLKKSTPSLINFAQKGVRVFSGIKSDIIESYVKDPEILNNPNLTNEKISQLLVDRYHQVLSEVEKGNIELDQAIKSLGSFEKDHQNFSADIRKTMAQKKEEFEKVLAMQKEDIKQTGVPTSLVEDTNNVIKSLKERVKKLSEESYDILDNYDNPDNYTLNLDNYINKLKSIPKDDKYKLFFSGGKFVPRGGDVDQKFMKYVNNYIDTVKNLRDEYSSHVDFPEIKKLVQGLQQDLDGAPFGEMGTLEQEFLKEAREYLRTKLNFVYNEKTGEAFQDKMLAVNEVTDLYKTLRKKFYGNDVRDITTIPKRIAEISRDFKDPEANPNFKLLKDAEGWLPLEERPLIPLQDQILKLKDDLQFAIDKSPYSEIRNILRIEADPQLKNLFNKWQDLEVQANVLDEIDRLPSNATVADVKKAGLFGKVDTFDKIKMQEELSVDKKRSYLQGKKRQLSDLQQFENQDKAVNKVISASHRSPESIRAMFHDISRLSDTNFTKLIENLRIKNAFENSFTNGSRNVNLWRSIIESLSVSYGRNTAAGGAVGMVAGGFPGAAIGAIIGGIMDFYGPAIAKKVLNGLSKLKKNFTPIDVKKVLIDSVPETARTYLDHSTKILGRVERDGNKTINLMDKSLSDYLTRPMSALVVAGTKAKTDDQRFQEAKNKVTSYLSNRDQVNQQFFEDHSNMHDIAPRTTESYFQTYNRALDFLDSKLPKGNPQDIFNESKPNKLEMLKFSEYLKYVQNPFALFDEMKTGNISQEGIEVLKNVYPSIYSKLVEQVGQKLSNPEEAKKIPMEKRLQMKRVFGLNFYPSYDYKTFSNLQNSNSVSQQQNQEEAEQIHNFKSRQGKRSTSELDRITNKLA